jgi:hypothetical protein
MPEIGTSGSMSGDGKRAIGKASSTAPILDSTPSGGSQRRLPWAIERNRSRGRALRARRTDRAAESVGDYSTSE